MDTNKLEKLKEYFENRNEIAFAFLYGSQAKGNATSLSDFDIAVYFHPHQRHPIEFEQSVFYESENKLWGELQQLIGGEVELLVLNRVSANVAASAIRGIPLAINDWGLYLDFMEIITDVAEDFMDFIIGDYNEREEFEKRDQSKTH